MNLVVRESVEIPIAVHLICNDLGNQHSVTNTARRQLLLMRKHLKYIGWAALLLASVARVASADITADEVRESIQKARAYLISQQQPRGDWAGVAHYKGGVTALCALALLNSGDEPDAPHIQLALDFLRKLDLPKTTYGAALQTMAFCAAEPDKDRVLIRRNVGLLETWQIHQGPHKGCWSYGRSTGAGSGDHSNAQFAILALHEAERVGVRVKDQTWRLARNYWMEVQAPDGGWGYRKEMPPSGSMTCAGIVSLILSAGKVSDGGAQVVDGIVDCCGANGGDDEVAERLQRGQSWLGASRFTLTHNPGNTRAWWLYDMDAVERVGRMTGQRYIGSRDWYREGAELLAKQRQDTLRGFWTGVGGGETDPSVGTALALLFLSKGQRPVLLAKLKQLPMDGANRPEGDLANMTRHIERLWRRDMTWQVIDPNYASAEDLLQSPVLFVSGQQSLPQTEEAKQNLRTYVNQGGFILAETGCGGAEFVEEFEHLMFELFPDSPLRLLPQDHPIWYTEVSVDPQYMPRLLGMDACCRTSVVLCEENLSCYWTLARSGRDQEYPPQVKARINAYLNVGANILAYATGRELRNKLDATTLAGSAAPDESPRGTLYVPKLQHNGGSDDAPAAVSNLLMMMKERAKLRISSERRMLTATDPSLVEYPLAYIHGRRKFRWSQAERAALEAYLARGGVIVADAICASDEFATAFRQEMQAVAGGATWKKLRPGHPIFSNAYHGYDLSTVTRREPEQRAAGQPMTTRSIDAAPVLEVLEIEGRLAVIFSPFDISCAMENTPSLECKGYIKEDAAKIGVNVLLYGLQQ